VGVASKGIVGTQSLSHSVWQGSLTQDVSTLPRHMLPPWCVASKSISQNFLLYKRLTQAFCYSDGKLMNTGVHSKKAMFVFYWDCGPENLFKAHFLFLADQTIP
jgi:hypothetical protein